MEPSDRLLTDQLAKRDKSTFEHIFKSNFKKLHSYAFTMLKDEVVAEEVVQNIFVRLWDRAEDLHISGSVTAYLYRAVHNESLNYLKHLKVRHAHQSHTLHAMKHESDTATKTILVKELDQRLRAALAELPEQCRTIFQLSRFEELKYREIADQLQISVKTVENQMGKALKLLRVKLADFLPLTLILLLNP